MSHSSQNKNNDHENIPHDHLTFSRQTGHELHLLL